MVHQHVLDKKDVSNPLTLICLSLQALVAPISQASLGDGLGSTGLQLPQDFGTLVIKSLVA